MAEYRSKYTGAEVDALLDKVENGEVGGKVTVDSVLSTESENPVMNKVITGELNKKADKEEVTAALNTKADKNETDTKLAELSTEIEKKEDKANKITTLSSSSTDTQYPSAKAVYEAIEGVKEKDYELLLDVTMDTDVDTFSVIDRVPNILSYKDYIILLQFKYQEGVTRKGVLGFYNANLGINVVSLERIVTQTYLTHYILRIHRGLEYDKTAFLESHTNAFYNKAYDEFHKGLNIFAAQNRDDEFTNTCIFNFKFYAGEKIMIYGK